MKPRLGPGGADALPGLFLWLEQREQAELLFRGELAKDGEQGAVVVVQRGCAWGAVVCDQGALAGVGLGSGGGLLGCWV